MRGLASFGFLCLLFAPHSEAQDLAVEGERVFRQSCAQGYCHGTGGTQGRAPKLIGRNFDAPFVDRVVKQGVPNTGMPGFANQLTADKLQAVMVYVLKISGADVSSLGALVPVAVAGEKMPEAARLGKALFFDADRGLRRCGTCHAVEGWGTAVGPNLAAGGLRAVASIRDVRTGSVRLARLGGDSFPAVLVERGDRLVRVYDLTALPPVLRSFGAGEVTLGDGAQWLHRDVVSNYSDSELGSVVAFLGWVAR